MSHSDPHEIIRQHLRRFFAGHEVTEHQWTLGPVCDDYPQLRVAEFAPGPKTGMWTYVTIGAWEAQADPRLEFLLIAPASDLRHVELVSMTAWYHGKERLDPGQTVHLGGPWIANSTCDHFLVSLPYPFGPDLEVCDFVDQHLHILWLLPITAAERAFKVKEGVEALEQQLDEHAIKYWDPRRASVV